MIEWPARENLTEAAKRNLDLFESTAAALELGEDAAKWRVVAWARSEEPPVRMKLRNESTLEELTFTREETGTWILARKA
jgi:hypothetical protein